MPLIGAAILPNSPALLPGLASATKQPVAPTLLACNQVSQEIVKAGPDILLLVAGETETIKLADSFALLQGPYFDYRFAEFGDLVTRGRLTGAVGFVHHLKEQLETSFPIPLVTQSILPYTFAVPLASGTPPLTQLPIACLNLPRKPRINDLLRLGDILSEHLATLNQRVAIGALGTLAQHAGPDIASAKIYDQLIVSNCQQQNLERLVNLDPQLRLSAHETLWGPLVLLYACLAGKRSQTTLQSYAAPLGIGFLVAQVTLS